MTSWSDGARWGWGEGRSKNTQNCVTSFMDDPKRNSPKRQETHIKIWILFPRPTFETQKGTEETKMHFRIKKIYFGS